MPVSILVPTRRRLVMSSREIHYRYAIASLTLAVIVSIGFGLYDVPHLVDKISFALTITSLVLGLVAIIYTFISASKQELQLTKLIETNHDISKASDKIGSAAASLSEQLGTIPPRFDSVEAKLDALSQAALSGPDQSAHSQSAANKEGSTDEEAPAPNPTLPEFKRYLSELPFAGMAGLYLIVRAIRRGTVIDQELIEKIGTLTLYYVLGLWHGAEAAGYVKIRYTKGTVIPVSVADVVSENIDEQIRHIIEVLGKDANSTLPTLVEAIDRSIP